MNKNLTDYVKTYNLISKSDCAEIIVRAEEEKKWEKHAFYSSSQNLFTARSGDNELDIEWVSPELSNFIAEYVKVAFVNYLDFLEMNWFSELSGFSTPRINRYSSGQTMAIHCDHIHSLFQGPDKGVPTLTALGILNSPPDYEGGELIMWGDTEIKIKTGDILVFPSNFLFPHEVSPVKTGLRYSFVSWAW